MLPSIAGPGRQAAGRGVAIGFKASISAHHLDRDRQMSRPDGSVTLYCSTVDMGQGSDTANAQLLRKYSTFQPSRVRVVHPDTDVTPYDMATLGSAPCSIWATR